MEREFIKALRSLPWYLVAAIIFFPSVAALFTAGWSLVLYLGYFNGSHTSLAISAAVGFLIWLFRQFWRAAWFQWKRNHLSTAGQPRIRDI